MPMIHEEIMEWRKSEGVVNFPVAIKEMEKKVTNILSGEREQVWLLEHPALYTAGTSAQSSDLLDPNRFTVYKTGRGGEYTYHGPGQRVGYVMMNLNMRKHDVRGFVSDLEDWLITTLSLLNVVGEKRNGRVGIWVDRGKHGGEEGKEDKIAAIGVRVRRWVTFHGVSLNVCPNLRHYDGIIPCGIAEHGVTSLHDLGVTASIDDVDNALRTSFEKVFERKTTIVV